MAQSLSTGRNIAAGTTAETHEHGAQRSVRRRWGVWVYLLLAIGLLGLVAVAAVTAYQFRFADRVYPGVRVAGMPMGDKSLDEAEAAIRQRLTPYPSQPVRVQFGGRYWVLSATDLGVSVDSVATAAQAYAVGRSGSTLATGGPGALGYVQGQWQSLRLDLESQWAALTTGQAVEPQVQIDENTVAQALNRIAREVDVTPVEGTLDISGVSAVAANGHTGRQVDMVATHAALLAAARGMRGGTIDLTVKDLVPTVTSVDAAAAAANALLAKPLELSAQTADNTLHFTVDRQTLRKWLTLTTTAKPDNSLDLTWQVNLDTVTAYLKQIAGQINRPVKEGAIDFDPKTLQVQVLGQSQVGQEMDVAAGVAAIEAALKGDQRQITLPVTVVQPKINTAKVQEMGIKELVSQGTSTFAGSSAERVQNIMAAASKFNNVVVAPGDEFSFNKNVGAIDKANGFTEGLVIAGDRTAVGIGGGVCQVSTTAFRAAFNGGFPIVERWAHGYVVGWYGKPGLDATIYTPSVDMRFKNDTDHYIVVKSSVDQAKGTITFSIYGTKPNRTVEWTEPQVSNVRAPAKPIYQEDKTLAAGQMKQVDWAVSGEDVVVVRKIHYGDGTTKEEPFVSHYQPWRAIYMYGPGTQLPPGALDAPADTPTATP